jgi:hypothetical protein
LYGFSKIALEFAVQCAEEKMASDDRVTQCVQAIRRYVRWIAQEWPTTAYYGDLQVCISELSSIAFQHGERAIADRLSLFARQCGDSSGVAERVS